MVAATLGWSRGAVEADNWRLRAGETYSVSIDSCVEDPNLSGQIVLGDALLATLEDEDGDGIPDWVEVIICGTTTCADGTEDTDGNGIPD